MAKRKNKFEDDPIFNAMALASDAEHFINYNKLGRYLMSKAVEDRADALEALAEADPENKELIRKLQNDAKIPQLFMEWLDGALAAGFAAEQLDRAEEMANLENYR